MFGSIEFVVSNDLTNVTGLALTDGCLHFAHSFTCFPKAGLAPDNWKKAGSRWQRVHLLEGHAVGFKTDKPVELPMYSEHVTNFLLLSILCHFLGVKQISADNTEVRRVP